MTSAGPQRWFFDLWSRVYDVPIVQFAVYRPPQTAVIAELRQLRAGHVLDVGCGTGQLLRRIGRELPGTEVTGLDFSSGMLEQARRSNPRARWVRADGGRLPFRPRVFDALVSTEVFHWFPDPDAALAEFRRVLGPGGHLLLALVNPRFALTGKVVHLVSRAAGEPFSWETAREMAARLERAGFRVQRQTRLVRIPGMVAFPPMLTVAAAPS